MTSKLLIGIIATLSITLISCDKVEERSGSDTIIGDWEWYRSYGSIAGITTTPETGSTPRSLIITEDRFQLYIGDSLAQDDTYSLDSLDTWSSDLRSYIIFDGGSTQEYRLRNDSLSFYDLCFDCYDHHYVLK